MHIMALHFTFLTPINCNYLKLNSIFFQKNAISADFNSYRKFLSQRWDKVSPAKKWDKVYTEDFGKVDENGLIQIY